MAPQIEETNATLDRILKEKFTSEFRTGYITVDGVCLPERYEHFAEQIENFEVKDDDVWVCTFPKTGTTWTQEMIWCIANDLDFEGAKKPLPERFPFLEYSIIFNYEKAQSRDSNLHLPQLVVDSVNYTKNQPSPRYIKTHLPFQLLPRELRTGEKKPRIIYVVRNPKDTCISYFHHCRVIEGYRGNFDEFCQLFLGGKLTYAPYWEHVLDYWNKKNERNILFLKYEDMKSDLPSVIKKSAEFLGKSIPEDEVQTLATHLSFANMKNNRAVNYEDSIKKNKKLRMVEAEGVFMRSGEVNQWKGKLSPDMVEKFDELTKQMFGSVGLSFPPWVCQ
ncbi:hypothetical protein KPH14_007300 [Odynerus spinipes]|uniref:Sulfotransferase domain-containing protein n=1 Tax=Odynerus spinipes TaxID=1348599 RepID=A0AAD9RA08_9HYME|nr:hypothetical protein KPH14_007300 [Odynerus spinipes]